MNSPYRCSPHLQTRPVYQLAENLGPFLSQLLDLTVSGRVPLPGSLFVPHDFDAETTEEDYRQICLRNLNVCYQVESAAASLVGNLGRALQIEIDRVCGGEGHPFTVRCPPSRSQVLTVEEHSPACRAEWRPTLTAALRADPSFSPTEYQKKYGLCPKIGKVVRDATVFNPPLSILALRKLTFADGLDAAWDAI